LGFAGSAASTPQIPFRNRWGRYGHRSQCRTKVLQPTRVRLVVAGVPPRRTSTHLPTLRARHLLGCRPEVRAGGDAGHHAGRVGSPKVAASARHTRFHPLRAQQTCASSIPRSDASFRSLLLM
jgi:hypothetical protein